MKPPRSHSLNLLSLSSKGKPLLFTKGDLGKWLQAAVNGDFDRIMTHPVEGVTLNVATLSHGVTRQSHVSNRGLAKRW